MVVEEMPAFGPCAEKNMSRAERKQCSDKAIMAFVGNTTEHHNSPLENDIEGTVVIEFLIDKNGKLRNPKVIKDIGGGCGKEAMRVVQKMRDWRPGKQQGRAVPVLFRLPIKVSLLN